MISVITGDIVKSRSIQDFDQWLDILKLGLTHLNSDTRLWEIYRGDSFQIEIKDPKDSFLAAIYLKACIKTQKSIDVRMAIGVGQKSFEGKNIKESNGEAYVFSGEIFETLRKEKQNLKIQTSDNLLNTELNLYFKLALIGMDSWTSNTAEAIKLAIEHPEALQSELGDLLGINQNAVSTRLKRGHWEVLLELNAMYRQKIKQI